MQPGTEVSPNKGEIIRCLESAGDGGRFVFELELEPGHDSPPTHYHVEGTEVIEVVSGRLMFVVEGKKVVLGPGERLEIEVGVRHTFRAVGTERVLARGVHGARFEALIDQFVGGGPAFTRLAQHLTGVDPYASRMSPIIRGGLRVVAALGRLRGIRPHPTPALAPRP